MEALEELKAIIAGKPEGAISIFGDTYLDAENRFYADGCWFGSSGYIEIKQPTRSLSDIERIIELMGDESRLDHLQKCNEIFNDRAGSNYGWKVDWNHNRIAIVDTGIRGVTIRKAIDDHIKKQVIYEKC